MGAPPTNTLYDSDILAWSEQQADALRALSRARPDLPNDLDLENIIEEIETVGRSEFRAVESHVKHILLHLAKAISDPDSPALGHWRAEAVNWQHEIIRWLSPSMRNRIDMDDVWRRALKVARFSLEEHGSSLIEGLPEHSPLSIDDLLAETFDLSIAASELRERFSTRQASGSS